VPPPPRRRHLDRRPLLERLDESAVAKLTVVAAPTGYGKTTVLSAWSRRTTQAVAWVTLDADDNDPTQFLQYVVTALGRVAPIGNGPLAALRGPGADPIRSVLPRLLNQLGELDEPVALVLDDYHLIEAPTCHDAVRLLLDRAPGQLRIVLSTRVDPPLPVGRLRARGELCEIRASDLRFSASETEQLLNGSLELDLDPEAVELLEQRTEGWPAGLYLAALSLQGAAEPHDFLEAFAGSNRHLVDYLGSEVLAAHSDDAQLFLTRTSILRRLSGPLCDAVLEESSSATHLSELGHSNLFLVPLDEQGEWYRYHRVFSELLQFELGQREPQLVPVLHKRAAAWYEEAGQVESAVEHAVAAGDIDLAARLLARLWRPLYQFGRLATLERLLDRFPVATVRRSAPLSFIAAMLAGSAGAPEAVVEEHLAYIERSGWEGPFPDTTPSAEAAACFVRAAYLYGDTSGSLRAADLLSELAPDDFILAAAARLARARALFFLGELDAALAAMPRFDPKTAHERPTMSVLGPALASLIELENGSPESALALARTAVELAEELGLSETPLLSMAPTALGSALAARGELAEAEAELERGLELSAKLGPGLPRAHALLALAPVRGERGDRVGARLLLVEARSIIGPARDPGVLAARLEELERRLSTRARREISPDDLPTESELRVLRLLASGLSQREIGNELFLSSNTIKSHARALYRKLGASSRAEAVARARELGVI
jgi:LuxR family maltose regulon positive regulatory protein